MKTMHPASAFAALGCALTVALAAPSAGHARTVYDAGAAFNAAGAHVNAFGDVWSLHHAVDASLSTTAAFGTYAADTGVYKGISRNENKSAPWVRVNTSTSAQNAASGEVILPNEFYLHPGNPSQANPCDVVRFTVPEAGWYSALVFAHDVNYGSGTDGVVVTIRAGGNALAQQNVSLESVAWSTRRFDFQMPVRWMSAGETIEVVIGPNDAHSNDATGLRFTVTKEDEGAFHDSGVAMANCAAAVGAPYANPYGTLADGTWYALHGTVSSASDIPDNMSILAKSRIPTAATRSTYLKGFGNNASGQSPCVLVNTGNNLIGNIAPGELYIHPKGTDVKTRAVMRFRPPQSGFYSGSVVVRDVNNTASTDASADGVDVYLYVGDTLVTNAYVSVLDFAATARFSFDARLMVAGEPVDIVVAGHNNPSSDTTGVSAIFRLEDGAVYDANKSFRACRAENNGANPYPDLLAGGATWTIGTKTNATVATQFYKLSQYAVLDGDKMGWWHQASQTQFAVPVIAMASNGIAGVDGKMGVGSDLLAFAPQDFVARPNTPGYQSSSPTLRATVPADGIYQARGNARDLNNTEESNGIVGDGILFGIAASGPYFPASAVVYRANNSANLYESILEGSDLWLRAGEPIDFIVDPRANNLYDATGLSACYIRESDATSSVINVDIGTAATGRLSSFSGRGREGFSDWTAWNALPAGATKVENCREADGTTPRNVTVALSGAVSAASGSSGCAMLDTGTAGSCTFSVSKLTPNAAYTLYLYGTGDAAFTVGGETKGLDGLWFRSDYEPCFARFEATADSSGEISGTFAASATGDAFSGLSLVGEFPEYVPGAFVLVVR